MKTCRENHQIIHGDETRIGKTPILRLDEGFLLRLGCEPDSMADVWIDLLHLNPAGTHKVLAYDWMIKQKIKEYAEQAKGNAEKPVEFVEYTTGNAGIAAAYICASRGYPVTIFMPENMSPEKVQTARALGAAVVLTPQEKFIIGAKEAAIAYAAEDQSRILLDQSANPNNAEGYRRIGKKFVDSFGDSIDAFVCGAGTYGTVTGIASELKQRNPKTLVSCIEAEYAPHLHAQRNGYRAGFTPHNLIGFGAERLAANARPDLYDEIVLINEKTAVAMMKKLHQVGLLVGKTSAANIFYAIEAARLLGQGKTVVTVTFDGFDRLVSERIY